MDRCCGIRVALTRSAPLNGFASSSRSRQGSPSNGREVDVSYNSSANIMLTNNTGANANLHLSHRYSDDPTQQQSWQNVAPGATVGPLVVGYNTGFIRYGMDWWWVGAEVLDGTDQGNYASEGNADAPGKECFLQTADDGKTLTFGVSTSVFMISEMSGPCTTSVSKVTNAGK
jgi:hypothetical protein